MTKNKVIDVKGTKILVLKEPDRDEYISLTDIARYSDTERSDYILQNWMRNRRTIEFIGLWEQIRSEPFFQLAAGVTVNGISRKIADIQGAIGRNFREVLFSFIEVIGHITDILLRVIHHCFRDRDPLFKGKKFFHRGIHAHLVFTPETQGPSAHCFANLKGLLVFAMMQSPAREIWG